MVRTLYTKEWRDRVRAGAQRSAAVLASVIVERFAPASVIDVGCGEGFLVGELTARGVAARGVEGEWVENRIHVDLSTPPYPLLDPADLVTCLEVAEHVDEANATELVGWLCTLGRTIIFSAAIPHQGGTGHVNEQWPGYWAEKFRRACGHVGTGALRWQLWNDERVEPWYRQNLLVFGDLAGLALDGCPSVVHPGIWSVYRP